MFGALATIAMKTTLRLSIDGDGLGTLVLTEAQEKRPIGNEGGISMTREITICSWMLSFRGGFIQLAIPLLMVACSSSSDNCFRLFHCDNQVAAATLRSQGENVTETLNVAFTPSCFLDYTSSGSRILSVYGYPRVDMGDLTQGCLDEGKADLEGCESVEIVAVAEFSPKFPLK